MDINIASYPELQNVNGFKKITFSGKNFDLPIIVIRKSTTEFTVLSSHCPHQGCEVDNPVISSNSISCHCHGSKYNLDGGLINGPSNSPLTRFTNTYNSSTNILTVQIY
jgi:Rieske Fe-S protein